MTNAPLANTACAASSVAARGTWAELEAASVSKTSAFGADRSTKPVPDVTISGRSEAAKQIAERLDNHSVLFAVLSRFAEIMIKRCVYHCVCCIGADAQAVQVVDVAEESPRTLASQHLRARLRTAEPDHLMARRDQLRAK